MRCSQKILFAVGLVQTTLIANAQAGSLRQRGALDNESTKNWSGGFDKLSKKEQEKYVKKQNSIIGDYKKYLEFTGLRELHYMLPSQDDLSPFNQEHKSMKHLIEIFK